MTLRYDTFALTAVFCIALMIAPLSQCSYYVLHPAKSQTQGSMQPLTEPLSVSDAAFVYDSESDRAILYGGWHSTANAVPAYYNETWSFDFDTNSWENLNLSINPGLRSGHSSAYDSDADMMLIYGGALSQDPDGSGFQYMDDTWGFDYNSNMWTNLSPSINPGVRYGAAMAFDSESNVIILFGGINYPALFGHHIQQTWVYHFDTNNWTNMDPDQQPVGRHKQGMVYDSESDRIIMFGGFVSSAEDQMSDETWTYDYNSNTWTEIVPTTSPAGRFGCSMAYDSQNDRTILYGGAYDYANYSELHDTWSFNLNTDTWTRMTG
ncbi:MAG: kelch repeat-containing protein, partial [Candidatus Thorarchaeota archaeon]